MAVGVGFNDTTANAVLAAMFRTALFAPYQGPAGGYYIQLHTLEPGPAGTTSASTTNSGRRVALGPMLSPTNGTSHNLNDITFAAVTATQTYNYYSAWDNATPGAGNFMFDGTLTGTGTIGQDFVIAATDLVASLLIDS